MRVRTETNDASGCRWLIKKDGSVVLQAKFAWIECEDGKPIAGGYDWRDIPTEREE
jgi:hypothetical protein